VDIPAEELVEYRELILPFGSGEYIVRSRLEDEQVVIVRVRHSREEGF
jgi:plasmid stabilization system protein ParE